MTFDEMGQSMKELRDNQVVQGEILHRVESRLDRLELLVEQNSLAIAQLVEGMALLHSAMKGMVATVEGLSATVDRFIRGLQGDGHHPSTDKPQ